jgi:hypothetical protein
MSAAPGLVYSRVVSRQKRHRFVPESGPMNRDDGTFGRLVEFLNRLDAAHVSYTLGHTRPES